MKHIDDSIILLGLVVTTLPFEYKENIVSSSYNGYIEITELKAIKERLNSELNSLPLEATDAERMDYSDALYFIDKIIYTLEGK